MEQQEEEPPRPHLCGILTLSDKGARGERLDTSGPRIGELLAAAGFRVAKRLLLPDERALIETTLREWSDHDRLALVITTGGTGLSPRDITPEATTAVLDRPVPGLSELMRWSSWQKTPHAVLSRGVSGIRGQTLIVNLPGSRKAAEENLAAILATLPHALDKLRGDDGDCGK